MADLKIPVERLHPDVPLPSLATAGAAGLDVVAWLTAGKDALVYTADGRSTVSGPEVTLQPGDRAMIPTGLSVGLPPGWEIQVRPRSGMALKDGVTVLNSPGTIDADYRGEIGIILINHGHAPFVVRHGERIAQLLVAPVSPAVFLPVPHLDVTDRGSGGFGSTGRILNLVTS